MAGACRAHGRSGTPHAGGRLIALGRCAAEVGGEGAAGDEDAATGEEGGGVAGESRAHGRGDSALITGWFIDFGGGAAGEGAEGVADEEAAAVGEADWLTRGEPMGVAVHQTRWEGSRGWRGRCAEPSRPIVTRTSPGRRERRGGAVLEERGHRDGVAPGVSGRVRRAGRPLAQNGSATYPARNADDDSRAAPGAVPRETQQPDPQRGHERWRQTGQGGRPLHPGRQRFARGMFHVELTVGSWRSEVRGWPA